jgi:Family of unknown function (DUF5681)
MAVIPPWQQAPDDSAPAVAAPRTQSGQFAPGRSGNPSGRPPGIVDRRNRVSKAFDQEFDAIGAAICMKAKAGDMAAAALYLSRVEPPLRPKAERVTFQLDPNAPFAAQASAIVLAVSRGELDPDTGKMLIECVTAAASLRKFDTFEDELRQMREHLARLTAAAGNSGGQVQFDMKDAAAACARPALPKPTEAQ